MARKHKKKNQQAKTTKKTVHWHEIHLKERKKKKKKQNLDILAAQ